MAEGEGIPLWLADWLAGLGSEGAALRRNYSRAFALLGDAIAQAGGVRAIGPAEAQALARWLRHDAPVLDRHGRDTGRRGRSAATVALALAGMSSLWRALIRAGLAQENPWQHVRRERPRLRAHERWLEEGEVQALFLAAEGRRDRVFVQLLYYTGARVSEVVRPPGLRPDDPHGLRWRDLRRTADGWRLTLYGKGGKTRTVGVPDWLAAELLRWRSAQARAQGGTGGADDDAIWPWSRQRAHRLVRQVARRAGITRPVSPHWLRHSHAVHALRHGAPINVVQATLGHASLATTGIYAAVEPGRGSGAYLAAGAPGGDTGREREGDRASEFA